MHKFIVAAIVTLLAAPAFAADKDTKANATPPPAAEAKAAEPTKDEIFYAVGLTVARQLSVFDMSPAELSQVMKGLQDGLTGKTPVSNMEPYLGQIRDLANARRAAQGEKLSAQADEFVAKAAAEKGAIKAESGLVYKSLREGTGPSPKQGDTVKVHYRGTLIDGKEFDNSYKRGEPAEFPLNGVISCWTEGVPKMKTGGKARLICPPSLAYGEYGSGPIPANSTLVFEIELLEVKPAPESKESK
ncbi:FKBP-type peptidyl-prolyl cis-trans isomerase [Geomesophilobacter sediminis]|uniref:Peptidyl-prolyl cis-trans isomerase n=1 Tax=Geomesophilobacter sediminis TaxID=2798584 RepID=A0A8J7J9J9_9BACT|nr:FKBP-type peptidyl-prolyl cis-trans isomerase [Geomesophilobacter sediminis]MBJ6723306.1 FKBP-type peptidyl-prolyl cis-trans isomerase [Geomesophilobacter sediminis]